MASVLIVYGSTTGNTSYMADAVAAQLRKTGAEVTVEDVSKVSAEGLFGAHDAVLFGCSTWGDEDIELQDDFATFMDQFDNLDAKGKKAAVFGPGDSSYTHFCGAVDLIETELKKLGAEIIADGLKVDGDPKTETDSIAAFAADVAKAL